MAAVSVVITTYERPTFLEGAIRTALGQDLDPKEVVVVDGGSSTDYARRVVERFPDTVRRVEQDRNRGIGADRNRGVEATDGEYVAFLDDDDRWHRSKLSRQAAVLDDRPEVGLVTCPVVRGRRDGTLTSCSARDGPAGDLGAEICHRNAIGSPSRTLVRRECLAELGGFDESLSTREDWELYVRLCQRWAVARVREYLCFKTVHDDNVLDDADAAARDRVLVHAKHRDLFDRHRGRADYLSSYHAGLGREYLGAGRFRAAREHLAAALRFRVTPRRLLLLALSFTTPAVFAAAVRAKRAVRPPVTAACEDIDLSPGTFPGLFA